MPKLFFRHGAMGSGKTCHLISVANNYEAVGAAVVIFKPRVDTRTDGLLIESRLGVSRRADYLLDPDTVIPVEWLHVNGTPVKCVLVDEAQFCSKIVIDQFRAIASGTFEGVKALPVICYGLRATAGLNLFEGSQRLFEVADDIEEVVRTICARCASRKAIVNHRKGGPKTAIEVGGSDKYMALCHQCYVKDPFQE